MSAVDPLYVRLRGGSLRYHPTMTNFEFLRRYGWMLLSR